MEVPNTFLCAQSLILECFFLSEDFCGFFDFCTMEISQTQLWKMKISPKNIFFIFKMIFLDEKIKVEKKIGSSFRCRILSGIHFSHPQIQQIIILWLADHLMWWIQKIHTISLTKKKHSYMITFIIQILIKILAVEIVIFWF